MLKKANRLRSQWDFKRTLAGARLGSNANFTLYGLSASLPRSYPNSAQATAAVAPVGAMPLRIGFIVSKKVTKKASARNKIKRRMREIFRLWLRSQEERALLTPYRSVVVIARSGSLELSYGDLKTQLEACFQKRRFPPDTRTGGPNRTRPGSSFGRNRC